MSDRQAATPQIIEFQLPEGKLSVTSMNSVVLSLAGSYTTTICLTLKNGKPQLCETDFKYGHLKEHINAAGKVTHAALCPFPGYRVVVYRQNMNGKRAGDVVLMEADGDGIFREKGQRTKPELQDLFPTSPYHALLETLTKRGIRFG